jgi:alpha-tubulin suppressor-like RCC1 family protein
MKTKFTTFIGNMCGMLVFGIMILSFASCLNPSVFNPSVQIDGKVDITGEVDVRFINSAVLWIVNTTTSVDVKTLTVSRDDHLDYPKTYSGPKNGSSLASYHPKGEAFYSVEIDYIPVEPFPDITGVTEEESIGTVTKELQMPNEEDYVIYIYRDDESKQIVIEPGNANDPPGNSIDKADPPPILPNPNGRNINSSVLVIHNMTTAAIITGIDFTLIPNGGSISYGDEIIAGDTNAAFLQAGNYKATINFTNLISGKTDQVMDYVEVLASRLGHVYFYLGTDKKYHLVQNWTNLSIPPDWESTVISDVFNGVKVRVTNNVSSIRVYAVSVTAENNSGQEFKKIVDSSDFVPRGIISVSDSKNAYFDEDEFKTRDFSFDGDPYTVTVYMKKLISGSWDNSGHMEFPGRNFFRNTIIPIVIDKDLVDGIENWGITEPPEEIPPTVIPLPPEDRERTDVIKIDPDNPNDQFYTTIAAGLGNQSLAVKGDGRLHVWGQNGFGQLGTGTTKEEKSPVLISGLVVNWKQVTAGYYNSAGITDNGNLYVWGNNVDGQLGFSGGGSRYTPTQVDGTWIDVAAGTYHILAIKEDGTLWAWGYGGWGALGQGNTTTIRAPTEIEVSGVTGVTKWVKVEAGEFYSMALTEDGKLYAWGDNAYGKLGDGTANQRTSPVRIGGSSYTWASMSAGAFHSAAITTGGDLYTWGFNDGRLGNGGTTYSYTPVKIGNSGEWKTVAAGYYHTIAIKKDGTLWAWGSYNGHGEIGDGTFDRRLIPMQIAQRSTGWHTVVAGRHHSLAIRVDGSLWAWGWNGHGQIGMGDTYNRNTPVKIIYKGQ